jgi:hypothetical protein
MIAMTPPAETSTPRISVLNYGPLAESPKAGNLLITKGNVSGFSSPKAEKILKIS